MARLKEQYVNEIAPALNSKFGYKSVMQIPKLDKVVINVACGESQKTRKITEAVMKDLGQITGEGSRLPCQEERCKLQAAPGHSHRLQGHPAR